MSPAEPPTLRRRAKEAAAATLLATVRPGRDAVRTVAGSHPVRLFTFHRVSHRCRDPLTLTPEALRERVAYVKRHHDVVDLPRALEIAASPRRLTRPVAALTFDDGYRSVATRALPVLEAMGVTAACFVCTELAGTDRRLDHDRTLPAWDDLALLGWDELAGLQERGWTIGAHTATHARLSALTGTALRRELEAPLAALRSRLGLEGVVLAYPYGGVDDVSAEAVALARDLGYRACLSNHGGENRPGPGFRRRRIDVGGDLPPAVARLWIHGLTLRRGRPGKGAAPPGTAPDVALPVA